jgi:class 3 adenylate cyclase
LATDVGPFTKSAVSFRQIGEKALQHLSRHLNVLESLRIGGHVQELDAHLTGVRALCRHFQEEVIRPLASVNRHDEQKAALEMARIGEAVTGILRAAGLELDSLDARIELIATIRGEREPVRKAVVSTDLWHYGEFVQVASDVAGERAVLELNEQIELLIKKSVEAAGAPADDALVIIVGDGATLMFDAPVQAYEFAKNLHDRTHEGNKEKKGPLGNKHFRVGIRLGNVILRKLTIGGKFVALNLVGTTVVDAARLQEACTPGGALVCCKTLAALPGDHQRGFGAQEDVQGKHPGEIILAHRRQIVPPP